MTPKIAQGSLGSASTGDFAKPSADASDSERPTPPKVKYHARKSVASSRPNLLDLPTEEQKTSKSSSSSGKVLNNGAASDAKGSTSNGGPIIPQPDLVVAGGSKEKRKIRSLFIFIYFLVLFSE